MAESHWNKFGLEVEHHLSLEPPGSLHAFFTGDSFFVTCFAEEESSATRLTWQGPTGRDITDIQGRVHVEPAPHNPLGLELVLEDVKYRDRGTYTCSAVVDRTEIRTRFTLVVHQSIAFWGTPKEQHGSEGSDYLLICNVRSDPNAIISWYVNGTLILNGPRTTVTEDGLYLRDLRRTDAGNYTCRAVVITPHNSQMKDMVIRFDVHYRPVWLKPHMETTYGMIGAMARLMCEAHAQPPPVFEWFRERSLLGNSRFYRIINHKWKSVLQVKIADHNAFGNYQCVVSNPLGEIHRYIALFEGVYPSAPKVSVGSEEPGSLTVQLSSPASDPLPVLGYRIQYKRKADSSWSKAREHYIYSGKTVVLQDLRFEEEYVVRGKSRNAVGYSNYSEEVCERTKGPVAETILDNLDVSSLSNGEHSSSSRVHFVTTFLTLPFLLLCLPTSIGTDP